MERVGRAEATSKRGRMEMIEESMLKNALDGCVEVVNVDGSVSFGRCESCVYTC